MPRKPRIEIAGYYHVINRGGEQRVVFKEAYGVIKRDKEKVVTLPLDYNSQR